MVGGNRASIFVIASPIDHEGFEMLFSSMASINISVSHLNAVTGMNIVDSGSEPFQLFRGQHHIHYALPKLNVFASILNILLLTYLWSPPIPKIRY